jgi:molybdopterin/thiamine biosynthesis adenylyltransferase
MKEQHSRFKDAPWLPKEETIVLIGGAGGIGSWTTLLVSRAGFKPAVFDFDRVESHNRGGQLFGTSHLGKHKVTSLYNLVKEFSDEDIVEFNEKYTEDSMSNPLCIAGFDNMEARRIMYNKWVLNHGTDPNAIFIDGRLNAEQMQIFSVRGGAEHLGDQIKYSLYHLFPDSDVPDEPCTLKQTSHAAAMIASHITEMLTNHVTNVYAHENLRSVPLLWEYFIPMNLNEITYG